MSQSFYPIWRHCGLTGDRSETLKILATLKNRRDTAVDILNSIEGVHCFRPNATFYLYPNVTGAMKKKGLTDYDDFRRTVLHETGVSFCTRLHFGRPWKVKTIITFDWPIRASSRQKSGKVSANSKRLFKDKSIGSRFKVHRLPMMETVANIIQNLEYLPYVSG